MKRTTFEALCSEHYDMIVHINQTKGKEYARDDDDALANFKRHATELGLRPEQVWAVYASKHWDAIMSYVKLGATVSEESIEGRIHDAILYLFLLLGLITDGQNE